MVDKDHNGANAHKRLESLPSIEADKPAAASPQRSSKAAARQQHAAVRSLPTIDAPSAGKASNRGGAPSAARNGAPASKRAVARNAAPATAGVAAGNGASSQMMAGEATVASKSKKKKRGIWNIVFYIALVVFIASLVSLGFIYYSYWKERNTYSDIATEVFDASANTLADLKVDWDALRTQNPETVAWIYVPETQINYPIVHTSDNQKYLKTNFQGETNWAVSVGAIFLETTNSISLTDDNTIIYGHNMNDGSMFSVIADYADPKIFNAHRDVYVLTPSGNFRIRTFALIHTSGYDNIITTMFGSDGQRTSYIQDKIDRSVVTPDGDLPAVADMERIFTFSTCDNNLDNARYVLFGYVAESTVPGIDGLDEAKGMSRSAAAIVGSGSNSFAEGNDVGD